MWLTCSSVGRKFVMALTGICLILFVTFHCLMNGVALFWPSGYNAVCEFLGANWYALVASIGLAALFIIHIFYAVWLTIQNRKARGNDRYAVVAKPAQVEWASQNMLVLGIVILAFLVVHLIQFWARMQLAEILHCDYVHDGLAVPPAAGTLFIQIAFSQVWTPIVYIIGFIAQAIVFTVRANTNSFEKEVMEYVQSKSPVYSLDTDANVAPTCCESGSTTVIIAE